MVSVPTGWFPLLFYDNHTASKTLDVATPQIRQLLGLDLAKESVLIACMPKTGSTFISNVLVELMDGYRAHLCESTNQKDQDLYLPKILVNLNELVIAQHHLKANEANLDLIRAFGIKTVVLTRNIFDTIPSNLDHMLKEPDGGPCCFVSDDFVNWDTSKQVDFLIDTMVPWYMHFYVSWQAATANRSVPLLWITYEELKHDPIKLFVRVLNHLGFPKSEDQVQAAVDKVGADREASRINVGKSGRGESVLSEEQRDRIVRMAKYYDNVDFTPLGID